MNTYVQWRRRIVLGAIAVLVAAGLAYGFQAQPIEVDTAPVRRAPLQVAIEQEGRTRVVNLYVVTAPVSGYARRITLDVGNIVQGGATLVELEPVRAEALGARQRAGAAASAAELAHKELLRIETLRQSGHASAAEQDRNASATERADAELRSAQFSVATAQHELTAAQSALKYTGSAGNGAPVLVRAPVAGSVLRIMRKSEGPVGAGLAAAGRRLPGRGAPDRAGVK